MRGLSKIPRFWRLHPARIVEKRDDEMPMPVTLLRIEVSPMRLALGRPEKIEVFNRENNVHDSQPST